jgi:SH3/ankyrin repeat-containing protein
MFYLLFFFLRAETPLTIAAVSARPGPLLLALVGGGALIDYRTRCGSTALHRAAEKNNIEAVRTLLDLGASPNYRDAKNLTPLWNAVSSRASPMLCQALLHDYSIHGVQDAQGWHEVHQVRCTHKFVIISNGHFDLSK